MTAPWGRISPIHKFSVLKWGMHWSSAYYHFGLPELASVSTEVWPCLVPLYHSLIWGLPVASSPNLLDCLNLSIPKLLTKIDAISLIDVFNHLVLKGKSDERELHAYNLGVTATKWRSLPAWKISRIFGKSICTLPPKDNLGREKINPDIFWTHLV